MSGTSGPKRRITLKKDGLLQGLQRLLGLVSAVPYAKGDAQSKTMLAMGGPKTLLADCENMTVSNLLTHGEAKTSDEPGETKKPCLFE